MDHTGLWDQNKSWFQKELAIKVSLQGWLGFKEAEKEIGEGLWANDKACG